MVPSLKLSHSERRTVSVETGIQNSQVAMMIVQLSGWSLQTTGRIVAFPMMYAFSQVTNIVERIPSSYWHILYLKCGYIDFEIHQTASGTVGYFTISQVM